MTLILPTCDGPSLVLALASATSRLERSVDEVNALNVYPVPDGDTGTNMLHTMRSALAHARGAGDEAHAVAAAAAHGALMGARGNSGVILSQLIRGLKDGMAAKDVASAADLCAAFAAAHTHAYAAVSDPAPGTILSAFAEIADVVGTTRTGVADVLRAAVEAGEAAVARTREENPTNRAAGVIDAGARGLWLLLDGALAAVEGRPLPEPDAVPVVAARPAAAAAVAEGVASWEGAYDVQYLISSPTRPVAELRDEMLEFGADCVLVVGDESVVKVHVHTLQPDQIIRIGLTAGRIADVVVEDLDAMAIEHERATGISVAPPRAELAPLAAVTVVPAGTFSDLARSFGAVALHGGPTMNPSTEELLAAIRDAGARSVIVLPNDKNIIPVAHRAAELAESDVRVVPTRNLAQAIAALVAFDRSGDPDDVTRAMEAAMAGARCVEVTRATRSTTVDGRAVSEGDAIGLVDGQVAAVGADETDVLCEAARQLGDVEVMTLYTGQDVDAQRAESAAARLREAVPAVEVEVQTGGQPHYPFVIAAE